MNFFKIGGYIQKKWPDGHFSCTCRWMTMEISRNPKEPNKWRLCKHIKEIKNGARTKKD